MGWASLIGEVIDLGGDVIGGSSDPTTVPGGWPSKWASTVCQNAPNPENLERALRNAPDAEIAEFMGLLIAGNPWMKPFLSREYMLANVRAFATTIAGGNDCENKSELGREIQKFGNALVSKYGYATPTSSVDTTATIPPSTTGDVSHDASLEKTIEEILRGGFAGVQETINRQTQQNQPETESGFFDNIPVTGMWLLVAAIVVAIFALRR